MNRFDRELTRRRHSWVELNDDEYAARYAKLVSRWHPAVAAVLAHEVTSGISQRWT